MAGEVDVFGQYDYLDVWNHERFVAKLQRDPYHRRRRAGAVGVRDLTMTPLHEPVLVAEIVALLEPARGGVFVDCTVGLGGHSRALLDAGRPRCSASIAIPRRSRSRAETLAAFGDRVELVHADYRELDRVLDARGIEGVAGVLADLGVSSMQLDARRARVQLPPRRAARHADGSVAGTDGGRSAARRSRKRSWPT